jgi:exodeoxyribonuclease VII large subunit
MIVLRNGAPAGAPSNAPEWSVSELAGALRKTLEEAYGHVRLRGEVSGYRGPHGSGHAYFSIKDEGACIDAVIWKTAFARLRFKPQEGLEVVATGRVTTFPGKSKYQIIVEQLEPAGAGALMALLEQRKKLLAAEGLFDPERKRPLPYLPRIVGVVTSPTGAVIRDILHRLSDRFPRHVLVWPARVQGETCAEEVAAGIRGFNALSPGGAIPRPDVIIVARGGGSLEDLWGFNEEIVVRAVAESTIPLVSAVGHETDWTLIDHAADRRAPTPTGAAEMVVPVRADLMSALSDLGRRHVACALRGIEHRRTALRSAARALPTPDALFATKRQRLDLATAHLRPALARAARRVETRLADLSRRLLVRSPVTRFAGLKARLQAIGDRPSVAFARLVVIKKDGLPQMAERLERALGGQIVSRRQRIGALGQLLASLSYKSILARGYALVRGADGRPVHSAADVAPGQPLAIEFADGDVRAIADGTPRAARRKTVAGALQGTLFDA